MPSPDGAVTVDDFTAGVDQLHDPSNGDVEALAVDALLDVGQEPMRLPSQSHIAATCVGARFTANVGGQPMGPLQEPQRTRGRQVGPVDVLLRRSGEDHRQADRIHAELIDLGTQIDSVAQRLAHRLALVDHLSLVHQSAHGFLEVDHPHVVQDLCEEPHVQKVQDGVLNPADVLEDRHPPPNVRGVERDILPAG